MLPPCQAAKLEALKTVRAVFALTGLGYFMFALNCLSTSFHSLRLL